VESDVFEVVVIDVVSGKTETVDFSVEGSLVVDGQVVTSPVLVGWSLEVVKGSDEGVVVGVSVVERTSFSFEALLCSTDAARSSKTQSTVNFSIIDLNSSIVNDTLKVDPKLQPI